MESIPSTSEIVEPTEEFKPDSKMDKKVRKHFVLQSGNRFSLEDDINQLFEAIEMRAPIELSSESSKVGLQKKAMKRPMRVGSPQISGIGICEPVNLKQALRGLCISQASEMAAMKRLSRPSSSLQASKAGAIKSLYRKKVAEPLNEGNSSLVEISLVPERFASSSCGSSQMEKTDEIAHSSQDRVFPLHTECKSIVPEIENEKLKSEDSLSTCLSSERSLEFVEKTSSIGPKNNLACSTPRFMKSILRNQKKVKQDSSSVFSDPDPSKSSSGNCNYDSAIGEGKSTKPTPTSSTKKNKPLLITIDERSKSGEKGEFSQSSKSSIGDYSCSTSISDDSNLSGSSRCGYRPHMSRDTRWEAIRSVQRKHGSLSLKNFKLIKKLGCGDIGSVYLAELASTGSLFALKVMDNEFLVSQKKVSRAETEREILQMLDHPFLPTLYAHFVSDRFSCLVMEHCPGGDLHVLRQKQPSRSFSEQATRFYVAEVLLALEYLHMLGVVYRDLKPENILVHEDGHIMLSDFDLSLISVGNPVMVQPFSPATEPTNNSCIDPFCLQPSWQVSCFTPQLLCVAARSRKLKPDPTSQVSPLPQLVVEPTSARSNSFVGTHEYLAPEIIKGEGHGSAVDWWALGIFLFELLYGRTPFKGIGNEETLSNVVSRSLKFPSSPIVSFYARDLIRGLLIKEPENRLGFAKGAAEIKQHAFFEGINWALIRCAIPPERPKFCDSENGALSNTKYKKCRGKEEFTEFEMF